MNANLLDILFHELPPCPCPYKKPHDAVYKEIFAHKMDLSAYENLIFLGCRRMGKIIYKMACPSCEECVPIRLPVWQVTFNRNQKRVRKRNSDIEISIGEPSFTEEKLNLYRRFLSHRFPEQAPPGRRDYEEFFVESCVNTREMTYRLKGRLIGLSTIDLTANMANAVYFFFDPLEGRRSPGIYNLIALTELCKERAISYLAAGYYLKDLSSMSYKGGFHPHELWLDGKWEAQRKGS